MQRLSYLSETADYHTNPMLDVFPENLQINFALMQWNGKVLWLWVC